MSDQLTPNLSWINHLGLQGLASLSIWLGYSPLSMALPPERVSLQRLGYDSSIVLNGSHPEFSITVPVSPDIDPDQSFVRLRLEPGANLNRHSSVGLRLNGELARTVSVRSLQEQPLVTLPLNSLPPSTSSITLTILPSLSITDNPCQDLATGNLFLTLGKDSFFQLTPGSTSDSRDPIEDFFEPYYSQVVLSVPPNLNQEQAELALNLYSLLAYKFGKHQVPVIWHQGQQLASETGEQARVILHQEPTESDLERQGATLKIKATPQAFEHLIAQLKLNLAIPASEPLSSPQKRTFSELGFQEMPRQVLGSQTSRLTFTLAQIKAKPEQLKARLKASFNPVNLKGDAHFAALIYFNNTLIQTYNLRNQTQLDAHFPLPTHRLAPTNTLETVFIYDPGEVGCQNQPKPISVQVQGDSSLTWQGNQDTTGKLSDLSHHALQPGQVIVDTQQPALLASSAYLLGVMSHQGQQPVFAHLLEAKSIQDWSNLPANPRGETPGWRLIAASVPTSDLPAPLQFQGGWEIYNPFNRQSLQTVAANDSAAILQSFIAQGIPTLWLTRIGQADQVDLVKHLSLALANPRTPWATHLSGNVVTLTDSGGIQSWDVSEGGLQTNAIASTDSPLFLQRYGSLLFTLALISGGVAAWSTYQRLGRPPQMISNQPFPSETTQDSEKR